MNECITKRTMFGLISINEFENFYQAGLTKKFSLDAAQAN